eukprot:TRINITY_DN23222_c0_g1_i1.p1 TRINITY_DN23222_c0_g1~~TRINITY_DN23222_c0_g1_i1.p1  ORF type:complete len:504 (+),score=129.41 TRINITY_DN23222_c0_g1_i1:1134-2645(+)
MTWVPSFSQVLTSLVIFLLTWYVVEEIARKIRKYPPTPGLRLPGIGHLYLAGNRPYTKVIHEWAQKLGGLCSVDTGPGGIVVILNSPEVIHEAFVKKANVFSDRKDEKGVIGSSGKHWAMCRGSFAGDLMRNIGAKESIIQKRLNSLLLKVSEIAAEGEYLHPEKMLKRTTFEVICDLFFGRDVMSDEDIVKLMRTFDLMIANGIAILILASAGQFGNFLGEVFMKEVKDHERFKKRKMLEILEMHRNNVSQEPTDFVGKLLLLQQSKPEMTDASIAQLCEDGFLAGSDTTAVTTSWFILLMAAFPEVQAQFQEELDQVVGDSRLPRYEDQPKLPYCNAVIKEVFRFRAISPIGVPRTMNEDVKLRGYTIPKGALVVANIHHVHSNSELWRGGPADQFIPDRFIYEEKHLELKGSEARADIDDFKFIPFGLGKRACAGVPLAKIEAFLMMVQLAHVFSFTLEKGAKADLEPSTGVILSPKDHDIKVQVRKPALLSEDEAKDFK